MCPKGRKRALLKSPSNALVLQRRAELDEIALEGGGGSKDKRKGGCVNSVHDRGERVKKCKFFADVRTP